MSQTPNQNDSRAHTPSSELLADAVERVRTGDQSAFRVLVEQCQRPLFRVLGRYTASADEAMDLVQQALIKAFEQLPKLQNPHAFKSWLFRIGINIALNQRRADQRRPTTSLNGAPEPEIEPSAERIAIGRQEVERVRAALPKLSPKQREVLVLRVEGDLSYAEIASAIGSTEGAVRVHFHQAVKRLRVLLEPQQGPSDRGQTS